MRERNICRKNGIERASHFGRFSGTDRAPEILPKCERRRGHPSFAAKVPANLAGNRANVRAKFAGVRATALAHADDC